MNDTNQSANVSTALRSVRRLWLVCGIVSVATLAVAALLSVVDPDDVNWVVWLRGGVVAIASFVFMAVTSAAARGSVPAFSRMRLISIIAPIGIVLLIVAPNSGYPAWMKAEQAIIGVLILLIALQLNRAEVRAAFSRGAVNGAQTPEGLH